MTTAFSGSSTSSKPPSNDIVKKLCPKTMVRRGCPGRRRRGGQPGHTRHKRTPFPPEQVDQVWTYERTESSPIGSEKLWNRFPTPHQVEPVAKLYSPCDDRSRHGSCWPTTLDLGRPSSQIGFSARNGLRATGSCLASANASAEEALIADVLCAPAHKNLGHFCFEQSRLYLAAWEFDYARRLLPESAEVADDLGLARSSGPAAAGH
jgi:hypothetical protein